MEPKSRSTAPGWRCRDLGHSTSLRLDQRGASQRIGRITSTNEHPPYDDISTSLAQNLAKEDPMYYQVVSQCVQSLKTVEVLLDKADQFASAKQFDVRELLNGRLAPDMKPLISQVQSACDYVKAAAAWLSGQTPPKHEDNEQTLEELRARVRKTVDLAESVHEAQYEGAEGRKVSLSWVPGKVIGGEDYLLQITIPNVYFHIAMTYAVLRNGGVDVGKMDFLGPMNFVEA